jgi:Zn-dependent protease with chaperone function
MEVEDHTAMPFLLMVFLTLVCLPDPENWPAPRWNGSPSWPPLWTALGVGLIGLHARFVSVRFARRLRSTFLGRSDLLRTYERGRFRNQILLFGFFVIALIPLGWGWSVHELWSGGIGPLPGTELVLLAPFLVAQLLAWTFFYDAERALYLVSRRGSLREHLAEDQGAFGSRISYVFFQVRQKLALVFLPVVLLIAEKELFRLFPDVSNDWQGTANYICLITLLVVVVTMPWVVRLLLGLRPIPEGPIRQRLMTASRRLHFRCSNLLLWNTRNGMANAMVLGVLPWVRYVVFTDRLLEEFAPDEIEAVFGHEVGHVKHHHMPYYLGFLLMSVFALGLLVSSSLPLVAAAFQEGLAALGNGPGGWLAGREPLLDLDHHKYLAFLPMVGLLLSYIFVVFGFLSRRCERQADIFGCKAVSCPRPDCPGHDPDTLANSDGKRLCPTGIRTFIRALEKVAQLNGINRDRPGFLQSWQHSTIARRVEFLQSILYDPQEEPRFQRRVALVKWALLAVLVGTLAVLLKVNGWPA